MRTYILLLICLFLVSCFSSTSRLKGLPPAKVEKRDLFQRVTMAGSVESLRQQMVLAPYDGNVKKIYVAIGDKAQVGAPLVSIESNVSLGSNFPLRANFPGTVTHIGVKEGEFVKNKDENKVLVRLDDLSQLFIRAKVSEADYPKIEVGQKADISIQALPSKTYKGEVVEVSLAPAAATNNWRGREAIEYPVEIKLDHPSHDLKPGMSAIIDVITKEKKGALSIPHEYIQRKGWDFQIETMDGQVKKVKIGLQTDQYIELLDAPEGLEVKPIDFYSDSESD